MHFLLYLCRQRRRGGLECIDGLARLDGLEGLENLVRLDNLECLDSLDGLESLEENCELTNDIGSGTYI